MIEEIKAVDFHDKPLLKFELDLISGTLQLLVGIDYEGQRDAILLFKSLHDLAISQLDAFEDIEINSIDIVQSQDFYTVEIIFLTGCAMPSWNIGFRCLNIDLKYIPADNYEI